jgi:hypothetical protein
MSKLDRYRQVATIIKDRIDSSGKTSYTYDSGNEEIWLPIINLFENEVWLGISQLGYWVLERNESIIPLLNERNLRSLLPCLQKPYKEIIWLIEDALARQNLSREILNTFPIRDLILLALRSQSDFWASRALEWLENFQPDEDVICQIQQLIKEKWSSQKTKLAARKFLKRAHFPVNNEMELN